MKILGDCVLIVSLVSLYQIPRRWMTFYGGRWRLFLCLASGGSAVPEHVRVPGASRKNANAVQINPEKREAIHTACNVTVIQHSTVRT